MVAEIKPALLKCRRTPAQNVRAVLFGRQKEDIRRSLAGTAHTILSREYAVDCRVPADKKPIPGCG
jgi:hypothetical protein